LPTRRLLSLIKRSGEGPDGILVIRSKIGRKLLRLLVLWDAEDVLRIVTRMLLGVLWRFPHSRFMLVHEQFIGLITARLGLLLREVIVKTGDRSGEVEPAATVEHADLGGGVRRARLDGAAPIAEGNADVVNP
jgi:hypothetical protein